ncbi:MAG: FAD:protein FMN transferase, partial [Candidatus Neomarinimicrobiota bacterium]
MGKSSCFLTAKARLRLGFLLWIGLLAGCGRSPAGESWSGSTMGTTYHITIRPAAGKTLPRLQQGVDSVLAEINRQMSTWLPESEISRFNRLPAGTWMRLSPEFLAVIRLSFQVWNWTNHRFDLTVYPLVTLWGFGPEQETGWQPPAVTAIDSIRRRIGMEHLQIRGDSLRKDVDGLELDVNAIAKGYGVDRVGRYLERQGIGNYLVEIGGEVRCRGHKPGGKPWSIGIDRPEWGSLPGERLASVLQLEDGAVATSGDYRAFHSVGDSVISHAIDPTTGRPAQDRVASATVVADSCALADALATSLMVMGAERGMRLIESLPGVEAYLLIRETPTGWRPVMSSG